MYAIHFFEKNTAILSQLLNQVPTVGTERKIKGRKAKIIAVTEIAENKFHVSVELEAVKKQPTVLSALDKKKKR